MSARAVDLSRSARRWKPASFSVRRILSTVLVFGLAAFWFVALRPEFLGGSANFVSVDGVSMTPTMHDGDLAVVEKQSSYRVGDIVAYRIPQGQEGAGHDIIHRIVGGSASTGFVTKGDHNPESDFFWHPKPTDIIGRVWFHIPGGARWTATLKSPLAFALLIGGMTFLVLAWPSRRKRRRQGTSAVEEA